MLDPLPHVGHGLGDVIRARLGDWYTLELGGDDAGNYALRITAKKVGEDIEIVSPSYSNYTALHAAVVGHIESLYSSAV